MSEIVSPLLEWLNAHPQSAGLVTFTISAAESVAIIGTIVPGSIMMTALGTLAGAGIIPLWGTIFWAIMGAIVGDGISYWFGHYFKERLPHLWPFRNNPALLRTGELFFYKYGSMSVFIGRFVGPVRALVPLVAGMLGMKPWKFIVANVTSAIFWAPAYMLPGILLGAASLELPPEIALHVILVLFLIGLFILLCLWFIYKLFQLIQSHTNRLQNWIWQRLSRSRYLYSITVLLKHPDRSETHGQLSLAFVFLITGVLFILLALYVKCVGPDAIAVNQIMYHFFRGLRTSLVEDIMIDITLLGQKQVILPVVIVIFAWLLVWKRYRAALHALALGFLGAGSIFVFKHLFQIPRPWGIVHSPETYSMPSGHAAFSAIVFMGLAFLLSTSLRRKKSRFLFYTVGLLITFLVGMSRLYLGAHWFTDVISAWLLSAAILMLVIISYQRETEKPVYPGGTLLVSLITLAITFTVFHHKHFTEQFKNYEQLNWPTRSITLSKWWKDNDVLTAYRVSLFGFPSERINIEWAGDLNTIRESLLKEGWYKPPARDWVSTLHRIADISSTEYLPLISPQYLDKKPALILTRKILKGKGLLVIRLWDSNRILKETNTPLWVGTVSSIKRSYHWLFKYGEQENIINPSLVFPTQKGAGEWQWKVLVMESKPHSTPLKILMVRVQTLTHKKK